VSDGTLPATQVAVTFEGRATFGGTVNVPRHAPLALTGRRTVTLNVGADTSTKSDCGDPSNPGVQPVPLTCTTVPGGPELGDNANVVIAASAAEGA